LQTNKQTNEQTQRIIEAIQKQWHFPI